MSDAAVAAPPGGEPNAMRAPSASSSGPPTFGVWAVDDQVGGWNWPLGVDVTLLVDDPAIPGPVNYSDSQTVGIAPWDPAQTWVFFDLEGAFDLQPGHVVTLIHGTTVKAHTVTNLAVTDVDPGADTVSGIADPFAEVHADACDETGCANRHEVAGGGGGWTADFSTPGDQPDEQDIYDIGPGSQGNVFQRDDDGDSTAVHWRVPNPYFRVWYLDDWAQDDEVQGWEWPLGAEVTLLIDDPGTPGTVNYSDSQTVILAPWDPEQTWVFFDLEGAFDIQPGHIVTLLGGTTAKTHTVTDLAVTGVDPGADTVSGTADPFAEVYVDACDESGCVGRHEVADGGGNWTADFSTPGDQPDEQDIYDIGPGSQGNVYQYDDDGDGTAVHWQVPNPGFDVFAVDDQVQGWQWPLGAEVTLLIDDPGDPGAVDYSHSQTVVVAPWDPEQTWVFFDLEGAFDVQPGHIVTLTDDTTAKTHTVTNLAVTAVDSGVDTVSGTAQPDTDVHVWVHGAANRYEVAGGGGGWTADFSTPGGDPGEGDTFDIVPGTGGRARQYDADGDATAVDWRVPNPRFTVWLNWGQVHGYEWPEGVEVTLTINDPGTPDPVDYSDSETVTGDPGETWVGFDLRGAFHVQPGYIVTMADGVTTKTHTVTSVAVTAVDPGADTVTGTATPASEVWIDIWDPLGVSRHEVAGGGGGWMANFSAPGDEPNEGGTFDIVPGTQGRAGQFDDDGDETDVFWTPGGTISGTVTDSGGSPILGIWVEACPFADGGCLGDWTATDGTYTTGLLTEGDYRVQARGAGYVSEYYDDTPDWGDADAVGVNEGADTPNIDFGLGVEGTISGTVTGLGGTPIPGASVSACPFTGSGSCQSASTESNGTYTIGGLAAGDYRVQACAAGHVCEYYNDTLDWSCATPVTVVEGADTSGIDFSLRVEGTISGIVTDANGDPIDGASVYSWAYSGSGSYGSTATGPDGTYTIGGLATGDYRVAACAMGYACKFYDDTPDWEGADPVPVTEGADTPNIDFSLAVDGTISGTVTGPGGSQLPDGGWVSACRLTGGGFCQSASIESNGAYTIGSLATADYGVWACATGFVCEYYDDRPAWEDADAVPVTEGADSPNIDFSLRVEGTISGVVTDTGGSPIEGCWVYAGPDTGSGFSTSGDTGADGSYTLRGLATGTYYVEADCDGYVREYWNDHLSWGDADSVAATEGANTPDINFSLAEAGTISGTVADASGNPITTASVIAQADPYDGSTAYWVASSQCQGSYVITGVPAGSHYVAAGAQPYVIEFYSGAPWPDGATSVGVVQGADTGGIDFTLEMGGSISGAVTDADNGLSIENASVCAEPCDHQPPWWWGFFHCTGTDPENGAYRNEGLATGSYTVRAEATYYVTEYYDDVLTEEDATCVPVVEGSDTFNIDLSLSAADSDGDGCTDAQEQSMGFDPNAWYDFYDVPTPAYPDPTPNGSRDRVVDIKDTLAVLLYAFAEPTGVCGDNANANGVDFDCDKNSDAIKDGRDYDRSPGPDPSPPWDAGSPDDVVDIRDVLAALAQAFVADCSE